MTQTLYFKGKAMWSKLFKPDEKYNKYSIDLGMEADEAKRFRKIGLKNAIKERDGLYWVSIRRDPDKLAWINGEQKPAGKPTVFDVDGHPSTDLIGNGSDVTVTMVTYEYDNKFGKGVGSRLESVRVDKLVEYKKPGLEGDTSAASEGFDLGFNF